MAGLDDITWGFPAGGQVELGIKASEPPGPFVRETRWATDRRTFRLVAPLATAAEATALQALWASTRGGAATTTLTPPEGGSALNVEIMEAPSISMEGHDHFSLAVVAREIP